MKSVLENQFNYNYKNSFKYSISVPPTVRAIPSTGQVQTRKGGSVSMECKASGNPVPSIYWTKKVIFSSIPLYELYKYPHLTK